jgi:small subunit ribosomal protein S22
MPPVVQVKQDESKVISKDPALKSFSEADMVFTDISFGLKNSDRKVVVRKTDGELENAPYEVRKRVFQIYFPLSGRQFRTPRMFDDEYLKNVLEQHQYEFVLDRLCLQYEPFEKEFHEISAKVYQHVNECKKFDDLRSTRHFGPFVFFLAWHKMIDDLILDMIKRDYLKNAVEVILLMFKLNSIEDKSGVLQEIEKIGAIEDPVAEKIEQLLHRDRKLSKSSERYRVDEISYDFIQNFVKNHSLKKNILELALQTYKEIHDQEKLDFMAEGRN